MTEFDHDCRVVNRNCQLETGKDTGIKIYKTIAVPTLHYGSELWVLTKRQ